MAPRSTRNKMIYQMKQVVEKQAACVKHIEYLEELAGDRSDVVMSYAPLLKALFSEVFDMCVKVKDLL
jgi:hypothetical protein